MYNSLKSISSTSCIGKIIELFEKQNSSKRMKKIKKIKYHTNKREKNNFLLEKNSIMVTGSQCIVNDSSSKRMHSSAIFLSPIKSSISIIEDPNHSKMDNFQNLRSFQPESKFNKCVFTNINLETAQNSKLKSFQTCLLKGKTINYTPLKTSNLNISKNHFRSRLKNIGLTDFNACLNKIHISKYVKAINGLHEIKCQIIQNKNPSKTTRIETHLTLGNQRGILHQRIINHKKKNIIFFKNNIKINKDPTDLSIIPSTSTVKNSNFLFDSKDVSPWKDEGN